MNFYDFQIRAWRVDEEHAQVMVHSSPAGDIRKPLTVALVPDMLKGLRRLVDDHWNGPPGTTQRIIKAGNELAEILLPSPVNTLLIKSLERVPFEDGLRVRLCLDKDLIDLPWEFLYRSDGTDEEGLSGFIVLNPRISLVREAPTLIYKPPVSDEPQRLVFAGTPYFRESGIDAWGTEDEYKHLSSSLNEVVENGFLSIDPYITANDDNIERALVEPAAFFHYSGHTDEEKGQFYLTKEIQGGVATGKLSSERLGDLLRKAQTRLAVFSACNSGQWGFVKPLLKAGLPALIGSQGLVSSGAANRFCRNLYKSLALGLSLDEAVTWARFHLLEAGKTLSKEDCEWGTLMVYTQSTQSVLIPKVKDESLREQQEAARAEREQSIVKVTNYFITGDVGTLVDQDIGTIASGGSAAGVVDRRISREDTDTK
jgi:CHAT domain